jgi:hypothetical protein
MIKCDSRAPHHSYARSDALSLLVTVEVLNFLFESILDVEGSEVTSCWPYLPCR